MRTKAISIAVVAPLVAVIVVGVLKIPLAAAQVDATFSPTTENSSTSTEPTSTDIDATGTAPSDTTSTSSSSTPAAESAPQDLILVHIIGTKYIDYFTDGTNVYEFPGDPELHAHIAEKDSPIPTHEGLTCGVVRDHGQTDAAGTRVEIFGVFASRFGLIGVAINHLDGPDDEYFTSIARLEECVAFAEGDFRLIDFNDTFERLPVRIDHRSPQLLGQQPGGPVGQAELILQLPRRHAV